MLSEPLSGILSRITAVLLVDSDKMQVTLSYHAFLFSNLSNLFCWNVVITTVEMRKI